MVIRKKAAVFTVFVGIFLCGVATQDIENALTFGRFPGDRKEFVERISKKLGLGNCSTRIPDSMDLTTKEVDLCFMFSKISGEDTYREEDPLKDISYLFYTCRNSKIYGEATYVFYRSSSYYQCVAEVKPANSIDGQLDPQVIAASPPDPTFLVWLTARLYSIWATSS